MASDYSDLDQFPETWELKRIGDFASVKGGKRLPAGTALVPTRTNHPYLRIVDFKDRGIDNSELLFVPDDVFPQIARYTISSRDIYVSIVGTIGLVGVVPKSLDGANLTENAAKICNIADDVDRDYLAAFLGSGWGQHQIGALTVGSTQPKLALFRIGDIRVPLPPVADQKAIAAVLGSLDDKIELNRRMNATLEAMARALFQSWFVDFDPVRAKLDGRKPTGLDPATAALFPDTFSESPAGLLPFGWGVKPLGDVIELAYGRPLKAEDRRNGPITVYGANGPVGYHNEKLVSGPGIVVGRKGNPGVVTWAQHDFYPIDTTFFVVPIGPCKSLFYLYYALSHHDLSTLSADSAVPGLNRNHAYMTKQIIPTEAILKAFDSQVEPLFSKIAENAAQSRTLATLRDTLLPKLLSGELTVAKAR